MKKIEKFASDALTNLHQCVGGTVYQTCGERGYNCTDEAGSAERDREGNIIGYDDVHDLDEDCDPN